MLGNVFLGKPPHDILTWIEEDDMKKKLSQPLTFIAKGNQAITLYQQGSPDPISLEYTVDDGEPQPVEVLYPMVIKDGQTLKIYATGTNERISKNDTNYYYFSNTTYGCTTIVSGNIQTLLDRTGNRPDVPSYCYNRLFNGFSKLVSAPMLPATVLSEGCYQSMFSDCILLEKAPELPAATLADNCYDSMFMGCSVLTHAPALLAQTLTYQCYRSMFFGCASLVEAPVISATKLAYECCDYMFGSCGSLVKAPVIPATTLVEGCYNSMFMNCSSLNEIEVKFTSYNNATRYWVQGVNKTGTFICPEKLYVQHGINYIPSNWTVIKK